MILIKLGGSVITNKQRPLSARRKAIEKVIMALRKVDEPVIIVHGGGSYGHYWSVRYDMHTKEKRYDPIGVATVKNSMIELDRIILDIMLKGRMAPYSLPPTDFMAAARPIPGKVREMAKIARSGMVPVTFGDALWHGRNKTYILSGDRIMTHLAKILRPRLSIFALNEDGLYSDMGSKRLIAEIGGQRPLIAQNGMDVTGGMARKVQEATRISRLGMRVFFVNGNRPERILRAIRNKGFDGTLFRGR